MPGQSPHFGRMPDAQHRSGLSRGKLYQLAAQHRGLFKKVDAATIVDLRMLEYLGALPAADRGRGRPRKGERSAVAAPENTDAAPVEGRHRHFVAGRADLRGRVLETSDLEG